MSRRLTNTEDFPFTYREGDVANCHRVSVLLSKMVHNDGKFRLLLIGGRRNLRQLASARPYLDLNLRSCFVSIRILENVRCRMVSGESQTTCVSRKSRRPPYILPMMGCCDGLDGPGGARYGIVPQSWSGMRRLCIICERALSLLGGAGNLCPLLPPPNQDVYKDE